MCDKDTGTRQTTRRKAAETKLPTMSTCRAEVEFSTLQEGPRIGPRPELPRAPAEAQWPCHEPYWENVIIAYWPYQTRGLVAISVQQVVYTSDLSGILGIRLPVIDVGPTAICED